MNAPLLLDRRYTADELYDHARFTSSIPMAAPAD